MNSAPKIVLSASRRTDIPAFYMPWFMEQIKKGFFEVVNPFNRRVSLVPATPEAVHTIVFWSKNFETFIEDDYGGHLLQRGYQLFFNFTINSVDTVLEPNVPPLKDRLAQLGYLCDRFGSRAINWRFDPICYFNTGQGPLKDNLHDFNTIAEKSAEFKVERCITSFMDPYPKISKRLSSRPGFMFIDPPLGAKIQTIVAMEKRLAALNIQLTACCEKKVIAALPPDSGVTPSSCVPNDLLVELYGSKISLKRDTGQRVKAGCGCKRSVDIGSYRHQPCYHNCLFCYANPVSGPDDK